MTISDNVRRLPVAGFVPAVMAEQDDSASASDDWRWQLQHAVTTAGELKQRLSLTSAESAGAERAESEGFPISITPHYLSLVDLEDPGCPIRRQVVPRVEEALRSRGDLEDPLGEEAHSPAPELVQRYPDRALLLVNDRCSVYCRFCTRSRMVGSGGGARSMDKLRPAFEYLERTEAVRDVIVSGGDPLVMSTGKLARIIERLRSIPSVETIRLATRVPVTLPQRITDELLLALKPHHPLWLMTHFNHPKELNKASIRALNLLADNGFPVMNQSVLLRGVNDDAATLSELFRGLVRQRARPYYLLQMDPVNGTGHLRTPFAAGQRIMRELQGRLSGIALPKFIVDTPGGHGKVPAESSYVVSQEPGVTVFRSPFGAEVPYLDPQDAAL